MDDIAKRLRRSYENWSFGSKGPHILLEAADAIDQLSKESVNCDLKHDGYAMDHHAHRIATELRKWWRFDSKQQPMSSWHEREDFIDKKLPELMRAIS